MINLYSKLLSIALSLWGGAIGAAAGIWAAFLLANILAWVTKDKSDSGFGFFIILTVPLLAIYGGRQGFIFAQEITASNEKFQYFRHGKGLGLMLPFFVLGTIGLIYVLHMFRKH